MTVQSNHSPASLLLLNGGVGSRIKHSEPKQFYEIHGHPIMAYTIIAATRIDAITEIVLNAPKGYEERTREILEHYAGGKPTKIVEGGKSRQDSTRILVQAASNPRVILHETARPMVTAQMYQALLDHEGDNAGYFDDIPFSMCRIDQKTQTVKKNVRREKVFNIQLPQKFDRETLLKAHAAAQDAGKTFTEDAVLVHKMTDAPVHALSGDSRNIKVTTPKDLVIASQLMKSEDPK